MGLGSAFLATSVSSLLFGLSFPPLGVKILAWVCLVPLFLALRRVSTGRALFLAWYWAVLSAWCIADALPGSISEYYLQPAPVGWLYAIGIWSTMASPYYMVFALLYRRLVTGRRFPLATPLLVASAWVAIELGRGCLFTGTPFFIGNPWGLLGYTQVGWSCFAQVAAVTGVYGMSFALVAVNAALAEMVVAWREGRPLLRGAAGRLGLAALPTAVILAYGGAILWAAEGEEPSPAAAPVAIVQGNVDLGSRWRSELYGRNLDVYLRLTLDAFEKGSPRMVFWPEAAMTFFVDQEPLYRQALGRVLRRGGVELVAGAPRYQKGPKGPIYYNSVFLFSEEGEIRGRYDKEYLVPFTEYFPLPQLDALRRRFGRIRVFEHGGPTPPLETRLGPAGILVCNEAMLPEIAARRVREGAVYLVNPSNDNWIADERFAARMLQIVSLRAIEQRRALVRASTSGPSAIIDPWGRVRVSTRPFSRDVITGVVRPRRGRSVYNRIGDGFAFLCIAVTAAAVFSGRRR